VVLVVPYGRVTDSQIESSIKAIGDKKLAGVVFNNEPALPDPRWLGGARNPFAFLRGIFS
jgi:hypothetical protein